MTAEPSAEIVPFNPPAGLQAEMDYARAIAVGSLVPDTYRNNPANVLIAMGLGQSMGLSPAESLYRINVIKGKPSAAAELIAANVRRAGHKLRLKVTEDPPSATCTIIRSDDPDEPTVVTRDVAWATRMGLINEPNYKKQPATMLSWRAISACARLACSEALYGVAYTPDEIGESHVVEQSTRVTAAEILNTETAEEIAAETATDQGDEKCPGCGADEIHDAVACPGPAEAEA